MPGSQAAPDKPMQTARERVRAEYQRGDYAAAQSVAATSWSRGDHDPRLALEAARAAAYAGRVKLAREWTERGLRIEGDTGRHLLELEEAFLAVLLRLDFKHAMRKVADLTKEAMPDPKERCQLLWLASRVKLAAAGFYELPAEEIARLNEVLDQLTAEARAAGEHDVELSAACALAERTRPAEAALAAFDHLIVRADDCGRHGIAAEAALRRAKILGRLGADRQAVDLEIGRAEDRFMAADHRHGPIDVTRARAELAIDRDGIGLDVLDRCVGAYQAVGFPSGALSTLMDLSTHAHRRGDTMLAETYGRRLADLAEEVGMGMMRRLAAFGQADLAMRRGLHSRARDWCDAALADGLPRVLRAGLLVLRGSTFSMVGDRAAAIADKRQAIALYEELDAPDHATDVVASLAGDIAATRQEPDLSEADDLLIAWIARDLKRGNLAQAVAKMEQRVAVRVLRLLGGRATGKGDQAWTDRILIEAKAILKEAEALAEQIPRSAAWSQRISGLAQQRGAIASLRGDDDEVEHAHLDALARFEAAGFFFEAANCRYLLGCLMLNKASAAHGGDFAEHAQKAEDYLEEALQFYDSVGGMRKFAAQTRHKLAMLYLNSEWRVRGEIGGKLRAAAQNLLAAAADDLDALRKAFRAADRLEARTGKSSLADAASEITAQALRLHLQLHPNPEEAWRWVVASKSRALNDLMAADAEMPASLAQLVERDPHVAQLVRDERRLVLRLSDAPAADRIHLSTELDGLHARMHQRAELRDYVELRSGAAADADDLVAACGQAPAPCAFVDWAVVEDAIWVFVAKPGCIPTVTPVALLHAAVRERVTDWFSPRSFRMTLLHDPDILHELDALVAPLAHLTIPDEHLILCPTRSLHAVPLHALHVEKEPLIVRNPVAYAPSLGIFRQCRLRPDAIDPHGAIVFGDPSRDRPEADALAREVAEGFRVAPALGHAATVERLQTALGDAALVHFQGHAVHACEDPLASHLILADGGRIEARRLFALNRIRTQMVVLGACESAASVVDAGDEQLGLIPAFLMAGARVLTAAQWRVDSVSSAAFMRNYYEHLRGGLAPIDAIRGAALHVRADRKFGAPYHWAAFTLFGDPWRRLTGVGRI